MTQRGIGRSAVVVGLLVLTVLVGGRMVGTWHTGQASHLTAAKADRGSGTSPQPGRSKSVPAPSARGKGKGGGTQPKKGPDPSGPAQPETPSNPSTGTDGKAAMGPSSPAKPTRGGQRVVDPTYGAIRYTGTSAVALTFDDGPQPTWTPQMLDLLRAQGVKATFCLVGVNVRKYPQLVARIVREGHTLCNHSWQHDLKLGRRSPAVIQSDLARTNAEIRRIVPGAKVPYYRQPGGMWTPTVVKVAKDLGMTPLGWAVDPSDWDKPGTQAIINRVMSHTHAGSIVLMHDGGGDRSETLAACRTLIPSLKQRYRLVALR